METLHKINIHLEVIDLRTIKPLDKACLLNSVKKTNRLVIVEEGWLFSGVGSGISSLVNEGAFDSLDAEQNKLKPVFA